jgi:hypothetical protein
MGYFFSSILFVLLYECLCQTIRPFWCQILKLVNKVEKKRRMTIAKLFLDTCQYDVFKSNVPWRRQGIEFAHHLHNPHPFSSKISCVGHLLAEKEFKIMLEREYYNIIFMIKSLQFSISYWLRHCGQFVMYHLLGI